MRWEVLVLPVGLVIGAVVSVLIGPISRRGGLRRARAAGAVWSGLANFDAARPDQAPVVAAALAEVGRLYGQRLSGRRDRRPVAGHLYVFTDRLEWRPWFYLGRGRPRPWTLPRSAITAWEVAKLPLPALSGYDAVLRTPDGSIRCLVVDGDGLRSGLADRESGRPEQGGRP
jgi:hypothetical protein